MDFVVPEQEQDSMKFWTASIRFGEHCFDRDWMAADLQIDDEAEHRVVLARISVEEFLCELVEILEDQPD